MMEALQMTKFFLKKGRLSGLDFIDGWATSEEEMKWQDESENDLLARVVGASQGSSINQQHDEAMDEIMVLIARQEEGSQDYE